MKTFTTLAAAFALFAPAVLAQTGVPTCAQSCVTGLLNGSNCGRDIKCICSNMELISNLSCCVKTNCDAAEGEQAVSFANGICKSANVSNLPQSPSCAKATGSSSGASSASSQPSTTRLGVLPPIKTASTISPAQSSFLGSLSSEAGSMTKTTDASSSSSSSKAASSSSSSAAAMTSAMSSMSSASAASSSKSGNAAPTPLGRDVTGAMVGAAAAGIFGVFL